MKEFLKALAELKAQGESFEDFLWGLKEILGEERERARKAPLVETMKFHDGEIEIREEDNGLIGIVTTRKAWEEWFPKVKSSNLLIRQLDIELLSDSSAGTDKDEFRLFIWTSLCLERFELFLRDSFGEPEDTLKEPGS